MEKGYLLGIDIGTYESKGVITDTEGKVVSVQVVPHTIIIPRQGLAEHDPEKVWWGDFCTLTHKLLEATGIKPNEILGVGASAIGACVVPVDKDCNPLRMGILYGVDTRAHLEINELNEKIGKDRIFDFSGMVLSAQSIGPKILWLKKNEPEIYKKAYKFITASSFLVGKLTGNFFIDHMTAGFTMPLYDLKKNQYSDELSKEICEIGRLPDLGWCPDIAGKITKKASLETGLAEGTPVIIGAVDAVSEAVSVGVTQPGQVMMMYGSTIIIILVLDKPVTDTQLWCNPYILPGTYCSIAGMATSGSLTRWFRDQAGKDLIAAESAGGANAYSELVKEAIDIPAGSEGLLVLPYFSGERTPINDPRARGVFFGMTLSHTRGHLFKAAVEGIGHSIRHNFDFMKGLNAKISEVVAVGGGTKNPVWLQATSDICNIPQQVPAVTFGASYGDAFLAGLGVGTFKSAEDVKSWLKDTKTIEPNPDTYEVYDKYHQIYKDLYKRNADLMHDVYDLVG